MSVRAGVVLGMEDDVLEVVGHVVDAVAVRPLLADEHPDGLGGDAGDAVGGEENHGGRGDHSSTEELKAGTHHHHLHQPRECLRWG